MEATTRRLNCSYSRCCDSLDCLCNVQVSKQNKRDGGLVKAASLDFETNRDADGALITQQQSDRRCYSASRGLSVWLGSKRLFMDLL